jgi:hypothetical protein
MKKIIYAIIAITSCVAACKKTTGLKEKNTVSPNNVDSSFFIPKAQYTIEKPLITQYLPYTLRVTNNSILADSSLWCFVKNGKYVVIARTRNLEYEYATNATDTLALIIKNKAGQVDTFKLAKNGDSNDKLNHIINVKTLPGGAKISQINLQELSALNGSKKVFVAVYDNGVRIDDSRVALTNQGWEVSIVKTIATAAAINTSNLPIGFKYPHPSLGNFKLSNINDTYKFKFFENDINGLAIDSLEFKFTDVFLVSGVPAIPAVITLKNSSNTARVTINVAKWY